MNSLVVDFIESYTHLLARNCGLDDNFSREDLLEKLTQYSPYTFVVDEAKTIAKDDSELEKEKSDNKSTENNSLSLPSEIPKTYYQQVFEKDDDSNWHVAFITAATNLRCENYGIATLTFYEAKGMAGKIVPAVATTTSIVSGLITIELMKYCCGIDNLEKYRSCFVSLANNILVSSEPIEAPMLKVGGTKINSWTKFDLTDDMILNRFVERYEEKFDTKLSMVLYGTSILYSNFMPNTCGDKLLSEIFRDKYDCNLEENDVEIVVAPEDDSIELPTIQVKLSNSKKKLLEII